MTVPCGGSGTHPAPMIANTVTVATRTVNERIVRTSGAMPMKARVAGRPYFGSGSIGREVSFTHPPDNVPSVIILAERAAAGVVAPGPAATDRVPWSGGVCGPPLGEPSA